MSQSDICKFRLLDCLLITHFQVGHIFFRPRLCEVIFEYIDLCMQVYFSILNKICDMRVRSSGCFDVECVWSGEKTHSEYNTIQCWSSLPARNTTCGQSLYPLFFSLEFHFFFNSSKCPAADRACQRGLRRAHRAAAPVGIPRPRPQPALQGAHAGPRSGAARCTPAHDHSGRGKPIVPQATTIQGEVSPLYPSPQPFRER